MAERKGGRGIAEVFWGWAADDPNRRALVDVDGTSVSYGALAADAHRVSHLFRQIGLDRGDGIAVVLPNCKATMQVYLATLESGLYYTPVNFHLTADEIAFVVSDCDAQALIVHERFADSCRQAIAAGHVHPDRIFAIGSVEGTHPLLDSLAGLSGSAPIDSSPGQRMLYTSGTTGRPKGVKRPLPDGLEPTAANAAEQARMFEIVPGEGSHLLAGPMYHGAPLMFGTTALHLGQAVVIMDKWTADSTLDLIMRYQISATHMVPTMFHRLLGLPEEVRAAADVSSLRNVLHAAAPCPVEVKRKMISWWGPVLYEYFGATEVGTMTTIRTEEWLDHPGSVGRTPPGVQLRIIDEDENECPPGQPGIVCALTPMGRTFEYYKDPEKTATVRRGEWVTISDIGYVDEDGWLYLCDRQADVIISGGVNVYPAEIEATLLEHPAVGDAAVIGVPNEEWGEEVKAIVELRAGITGDDDLAREIFAFCGLRLAGFKTPRSIEFRDLPRYTSGKLYRRRLRDEYWKERATRI